MQCRRQRLVMNPSLANLKQPRGPLWPVASLLGSQTLVVPTGEPCWGLPVSVRSSPLSHRATFGERALRTLSLLWGGVWDGKMAIQACYPTLPTVSQAHACSTRATYTPRDASSTCKAQMITEVSPKSQHFPNDHLKHMEIAICTIISQRNNALKLFQNYNVSSDYSNKNALLSTFIPCFLKNNTFKFRIWSLSYKS